MSFEDWIRDGFSPSSEDDWAMLDAATQTLFRPRTPIDDSKLFAGRIEQIRELMDVIYEPGGHAIIFGERGVGKTSIANIIHQKIAPQVLNVRAIPVDCSTKATFADIWGHALDGFELDDKPVVEVLKGITTPYPLYNVLEQLPSNIDYVFIFDEFDRLKDPDVQSMMTDTIKHLSNTPRIKVTIVIVGVAHTISKLFNDHESIIRATTQIKMPRMSRDELAEIITERLPLLHVTMQDSVLDKMIRYSQGLPGYMHLLGQLSTRAALGRRSMEVEREDLVTAVGQALEKAHQSTREDYYRAIESSHPDSTYKEVLLACALAETNELGKFFAKSLREPYSDIRKKKMEIFNFSPQLGNLCSEERGPALIRTGVKKKFQYEFANPLLQPLVIMMGLKEGLIDFDSY
jgi:Cdc6-like AAA superfamily ATPase